MRGTAAALAMVLFAACGDGAEVASDAPRAEVRPEPHPGEALYRRYCALCHGREGEGYAADNAPQLAGQEFLRSASDQFLDAAIAAGRPGTPMSAWSREHGGPLTDEEIGHIRG